MRIILVLILTLFLSVSCSGRQSIDPESVIKFANSQDIDSSAHWVNSATLALPSDLNASHRFLIGFPDGINGNAKPSIYQIKPALSERLPKDLQLHFPEHIAYGLSAERQDLAELLRGEVFVAGIANGKLTSLNIVQTGGAVDSLYTFAVDDADEVSDYGAAIIDGSAVFKIWAPTVKSISLRLYDKKFDLIQDAAMERDEYTGLWAVSIDVPEHPIFYRYKITSFHPMTQSVESYEVTDPYSRALSINGDYSQLLDLNSETLKPEGWDSHERPLSGPKPQDIIYRLAVDELFSENELAAISDQMTTYLSHLAKVGITTLNLKSMPESSPAEAKPSVNHFLVPDEGFSESIDDTTRTGNFRQFVQDIHNIDLQIIIDIPAGYSGESGIGQNAILDKIVPGYYVSRDLVTGNPIKKDLSYAMNTNRKMTAKLIRDTQIYWAKQYQIDGFNFSQTEQWRNPLNDIEQSLPDFISQGEPNKSINFLSRQELVDLLPRKRTQILSQILMSPGIPLIEPTEFTPVLTPNNQSSLVYDLMEIRNSSPLFHLTDRDAIKSRFGFPVRGKTGGGLTVLTIDDGYLNESHPDLDPNYSQIVVVFNLTGESQKTKLAEAGRLRLHPIQVNGSDPIVRRSQITLDQIIVPPQTTAVFVRPQ